MSREDSSMSPTMFRRFQEIALRQAGISIREGKETLVSCRVEKRLRALGMSSVSSYLDLLESEDSGREIVAFLDAISTNFTSFYREPSHFEMLDKVVRQWLRRGQARIRIWCAAASTGEEPYTIAMTVLNALDGRPDVDFRLLATDISTRVLAEAREGVYPEARLAPVPPALRKRYFKRRAGGLLEARQSLKERIRFGRLNLARTSYPMSGPFDCIFCRNVLIYFDTPMRQGVVGQCERLLRVGELLFIGHSETLTGLETQFEALCPSVYRLGSRRRTLSDVGVN